MIDLYLLSAGADFDTRALDVAARNWQISNTNDHYWEVKRVGLQNHSDVETPNSSVSASLTAEFPYMDSPGVQHESCWFRFNRAAVLLF